MTEINIASLRARLLDAALCDGLSLDDAEKRARQAMAWVERGDAPLMIEGPKKAASTPPSSPLPKPKTVVVDLQIALVGKTDASKPPQSGADPISERDKTIRKEYAKHTPIGQIAKILGCSPPTIYHALKRMGIPLHGATNASRALVDKHPTMPLPPQESDNLRGWTNRDEASLRGLYGANVSITDIAKRLSKQVSQIDAAVRVLRLKRGDDVSPLTTLHTIEDTNKLDQPVRRRCESCTNVFEAVTVGDRQCPKCLEGRLRA